MNTVTIDWPITRVRVHPDRLKTDVLAAGTYRGIPIEADPALPLNEIHIDAGGRHIVLRLAAMKREEG